MIFQLTEDGSGSSHAKKPHLALVTIQPVSCGGEGRTAHRLSGSASSHVNIRREQTATRWSDNEL